MPYLLFMETPLLFELIGYVASVLVAVSLMMSNIVRLRVLNMLGALTFVAYGALIAAWPVAFMNAFIVGINIFYLVRMRRNPEYFKLLRTTATDEYLSYVLSFHRKEIRANQPEFDFVVRQDDLCVLVLRDTVPAGVLIGRIDGPTLHVTLDFVPPAFRDFKIGRFLWVEKAAFFTALGIREVVALPGDAEHRGYLTRMGFNLDPSGAYRLALR